MPRYLSHVSQLAKSGQGRVFVTDNILATLMTCTRSVYSFDITVTKVGDKIFFDKRDDSSFGMPTPNRIPLLISALLDLPSVDENANETPSSEGESINAPLALAAEAALVGNAFSQAAISTVGCESGAFIQFVD